MIINKKYLAECGVLPINYDFSEIMPYVDIAERLWVIPLIGRDFYDELNEQVKNNQVSDENAALFIEGGLYAYLSYATVLQALPFIWSHISAVGLTTGKSENSDSVTLKDLTYITNHLRSTVEYLKEQVIKYICERPEYFPLVCQCQCECGSCCANKASLKSPQKYKQIYTTNRKCADLI